MNSCRVSGWIQSTPELRITRDSRRIINFQIAVEGPGEPYVPCGYLLGRDEVIELRAGERVSIYGRLKHRPGRWLFLAAETIRAIEESRASEPEDAHAR